jgi:hypothetical protein
MGIDEIGGKQRCGETHDTARYRNGGGKPDTAATGDADPDAPNKLQPERTEPACSKTKVRRLVRKMTITPPMSARISSVMIMMPMATGLDQGSVRPNRT